MWQILCRVSGGVTGTREAILKENGTERYFETKEEAQAVADELNRSMNHRYSTADFHYRPIEA